MSRLPLPPPPDEGENLLDRMISGARQFLGGEPLPPRGPVPEGTDVSVVGGALPVGGGAGLKAALLGVAAAAVPLIASRLKMPWETAAGEGVIAPWSNMMQLPSGEWVQDVNAQRLGGVATPIGAPITDMSLAALGNYPIRQWTNAARNGTSPATVLFVQYANGRIVSQSLVSGRVKTWKPKKHIVISQNPRMSQINKLDRTHRRVVKRLRKMKGIK